MAELKHVGTPRHSGRYPWGSGKSGYQRTGDFLADVEKLERQGLTQVEIAKGLGLGSTTELRKKISVEKDLRKAGEATLALRLKDKGLSNVAIGERIGRNESYVRLLLDPAFRQRALVTKATADRIKDSIDKYKYVDVGAGVEILMGVPRTKFNTALYVLEQEGYVTHPLMQEQQGTPGQYTKYLVITPPGTTRSEASKNRDKIKLPEGYSLDGGLTYQDAPKVFESIKRDRVFVRYGDQGGVNKDGVIELRRNVEDLSLGGKQYAQVRVKVGDNLYMKGMAMYSDNIPEGHDIVYNTNKKTGTPDGGKGGVFKELKINKETGEIDADIPFGSIITQKTYKGADGKEHLSPLNRVGSKPGSGEEGSWEEWSRNISSQVLSKQKPELAKKQLKETFDRQQDDFDEIMSLTNPLVKKRLLESFADGADSAAEHLKAAALPRQASQVILPILSLKENEVYAPNFNHGENVVLIRHPHGGIFEIPELIVNNRNQEAKKVMGNAQDAVGINPEVAKRLSGADFDGDTVIVIPNKEGHIKTDSPIKSIIDFDPKEKYPYVEGMKVMDKSTKAIKMGEISNLITDMTIGGANRDEIARAVRHSMVVIDAEKHRLDYKRSYNDENITQLKIDYQGSSKGGASTLISKAKSPYFVDQRREGVTIVNPKTGKKSRLYIDPKTGEKLYTPTGKVDDKIKIKTADGKSKEYYVKYDGDKPYVNIKDPQNSKYVKQYVDPAKIKKVPRKTKSTKMAEEKDAFNLSSGSRIEDTYAAHANSLKSLANKARKAAYETHPLPYSPSARKVYAKEVSALKTKLALALRNAPYERQAQLLAGKKVSQQRRSNPNMDKDDLKKLRGQAIVDARDRVGAKKHAVEITDREWEAIQAGAISGHALDQILLNTDMDKLREKAMPKTSRFLSPNRVARAQAMRDAGSTQSEIAQALGVPVDVVNKVLE